MFRDLFSFAVGAIVALVSVIPYDAFAKKFETERAWFARIYRLGEIEARKALDVDWIGETQFWEDFEKECAKNAVAGMPTSATEDATTPPLPNGYNKVAEKFEKNPDLRMDPYSILNKTYLDNRDQIDKQALSSVMEARNADRTSQQVAAALSEHFPGDIIHPRMIRSTGSPGSEIDNGCRPLFAVKIPRTEESGSEFERRADLVATPDVVEPALERLLDEVELELEANANESNKNENEQPVIPAETLAGDA